MRVVPGTITLSENIVCVICQTSAVIFSKNASSSGSRDAMRSSGSAFGVAELRRPRGAERLAHPLQLAAREAVGERERLRAVDADHLRLPLLDHLLQRLPLLVAPELGLPAADRGRDRLRGGPRLEDAALRRPAERDALDAGRRRPARSAAAHLSKNT